MKLSRESEELVKLEYSKAAEEISKKHFEAVARYERTMPRGGDRKKAIDNEFIHMAESLIQAKLNIYLEAFRRENVTPDENYIAKIVSDFEEIVRSLSHNTHHPPSPSSVESYGSIVSEARRDLRIDLKRMLLERQKPGVQETERMNINAGDTYNNYGQVGAFGANAHAHDLTLNQSGSQLENLSPPMPATQILATQQNSDRLYMERAVAEARKSRDEDGRTHPKKLSQN